MATILRDDVKELGDKARDLMYAISTADTDNARESAILDRCEQLVREAMDGLRLLHSISNPCDCCANNDDDPEHYHSDVCSPDYVEPDYPIDHEEGE